MLPGEEKDALIEKKKKKEKTNQDAQDSKTVIKDGKQTPGIFFYVTRIRHKNIFSKFLGVSVQKVNKSSC